MPSASDVRAGGAFYEIYAKNGVTGVLDKIERDVAKFGGKLRKLGGTLMGTGGALGAGPLGFLLGGIGNATEISQLSRQFMIPVEMMAKLKYAADAAGTSVEEVFKNPGKFADLLAEAPGMNADDIARAVEAQKEWRLTTLALQDAMLSMLDVINPLLKQVAGFVRENAAGITIVAALAAAIFGLGAAFSVAGIAIGVVSTLFAAVTTPIGAVLLGVGALVIIFRDKLAPTFEMVGEVFRETWEGIVDALRSGKLELAFEIVAAGIKVIWFKMLQEMTQAFVSTLHGIVTKYGAIAAVLAPGLLNTVGLVGTPLGMGFLDYLTSGVTTSQADLARLRQQAAAGVQTPQQQQLIRAAEATKGMFGSNRAAQSLNYGEKSGIAILQDIRDGKGGLPDAIGAAMAAALVVR